MSSDKQIAANRLNAQRSTGPRTPSGKAKVSPNALKHGLTARDVVLPGENPDDFESFRADLMASLDLEGTLENALGEMIVDYLWRLRRVPIFEATLFKRGCAELLVSQAEELVTQSESTDVQRQLESLVKNDVVVRDPKAHEDAKRRLAASRAQLDGPFFDITRVLETTPGPFLNLWRHDAALSRSMLRTLHELERLQAKRAGKDIPVPAIVDVDLSLPEIRSCQTGS